MRIEGRLLLSIGCVCILQLALPFAALSEPVKRTPPKNGFEAVGLKVTSPFRKNFAEGFFGGEVVDVTDKAENPKTSEAGSVSAPQSSAEVAATNAGTAASPSPINSAAAGEIAAKDEHKSEEVSGPSYSEIISADKEKILGRVDRSAPSSFQDMVYKFRTGDTAGAQESAGQFVDYMMNLMFETRVYAQMIGEELMKKQLIDEDDWDGVEQYLDYTMAEARKETNSVIRPTHEAAMKQITPDAKGQAEIYYFFTLNCSYCRHMAPDVERLWRSVKKDPKVRMAALTLGSIPKEWVKEYRDYTGLTMPIRDGEQVAKAFNVAFVPAIVVVSPSGNRAYLKTGQQDFSRMYEFVRTVQGMPATLSPELAQIVNVPIGEVETEQARTGNFKAIKFATQAVANDKTQKVLLKKNESDVVGKF